MSIDPEMYQRWRQERDALRAIRGYNFALYRDEYELKEQQMAEAKKEKKEAVKDEPAPVMEQIVTCVPQVSQDPFTILLVGAGGNGARIVPPLTQMLRRRDRLFIMDHDIVEDRNLTRQHFADRDIGQPKALVLAQRYAKRDLHPTALVTQLTPANVGATISGLDFTTPRNHLIIIGCVDNNDTRKILMQMLTSGSFGTRVPYAGYIDVGNERRGGQVLMSLRNWPLVATQLGQTPVPARLYNMATMADAMPQLAKPTPWACDDCAVENDPGTTKCAKCGREAGSCGNRLDLQTVMVNHMAAGMVLNCLSWLMLGIPFTTAGAFFSTLNSIQPIRIKSVDHAANRIFVDTGFAER